jgi:hypothetical protein
MLWFELAVYFYVVYDSMRSPMPSSTPKIEDAIPRKRDEALMLYDKPMLKMKLRVEARKAQLEN